MWIIVERVCSRLRRGWIFRRDVGLCWFVLQGSDVFGEFCADFPDVSGAHCEDDVAGVDVVGEELFDFVEGWDVDGVAAFADDLAYEVACVDHFAFFGGVADEVYVGDDDQVGVLE